MCAVLCFFVLCVCVKGPTCTEGGSARAGGLLMDAERR